MNISIHAPLTGSDFAAANWDEYLCIFQSTLPSQGATPLELYYYPDFVFQSTLPSQGATHTLRTIIKDTENFNPRSPHRERLQGGMGMRDFFEFQSTLPSQGATKLLPFTYVCIAISIHAPLTGSDGQKVELYHIVANFNPRSPHRERRA